MDRWGFSLHARQQISKYHESWFLYSVFNTISIRLRYNTLQVFRREQTHSPPTHRNKPSPSSSSCIYIQNLFHHTQNRRFLCAQACQVNFLPQSSYKHISPSLFLCFTLSSLFVFALLSPSSLCAITALCWLMAASHPDAETEQMFFFLCRFLLNMLNLNKTPVQLFNFLQYESDLLFLVHVFASNFKKKNCNINNRQKHF